MRLSLDWLEAEKRELEARVRELEERIGRAVYLAEHLFQMTTPEQWRATGGDDGQGHYEGDYRAEQTVEELKELRSLVPAKEETDG